MSNIDDDSQQPAEVGKDLRQHISCLLAGVFDNLSRVVGHERYHDVTMTPLVPETTAVILPGGSRSNAQRLYYNFAQPGHIKVDCRNLILSISRIVDSVMYAQWTVVVETDREMLPYFHR